MREGIVMSGTVEERARDALESVSACPPLTFTKVGHKRRVSGRQMKAIIAADLRIVDAAEDDRRAAENAALWAFWDAIHAGMPTASSRLALEPYRQARATAQGHG